MSCEERDWKNNIRDDLFQQVEFYLEDKYNEEELLAEIEKVLVVYGVFDE